MCSGAETVLQEGLSFTLLRPCGMVRDDRAPVLDNLVPVLDRFSVRMSGVGHFPGSGEGWR